MNQILKEPNKLRIKESDLEFVSHSHGGYMTVHYQGKPFNGFWVIDYHENGNVMFEEEYRNGEHQSWDNKYYETGELKESDLMLGATTLKYWKFDKEGNITKEGKQVSKEDYESIIKQYNLLD